jgi:hypothetical protein
MYAANAYTIRRATAEDVDALYRLAQLDSDPRPMTGRVIVGEIKGELAAAVAVADDRVIADPFRPTAQLVAHLRRRAAALRAAEQTPALRDRIRAGLSRRERVRPRSVGEVA